MKCKKTTAAFCAVWLNAGAFASCGQLMGAPADQLSTEFVLP